MYIKCLETVVLFVASGASEIFSLHKGALQKSVTLFLLFDNSVSY